MSQPPTRDFIRAAADWKAFKAGSELHRRRAVASVERTGDGWRGAVTDGRKTHRLRVIAQSSTDIDVRCSCAENRESGSFCAHAVATGLAVAEPLSTTQATPDERTPAPEAGDAAAPPAPALAIHFPPQWDTMLASGRLPLRVTRNDTRAPEPGDERLAAWLAANRVPPSTAMLDLQGPMLAAFLDAAADHPDVHATTSEGVHSLDIHRDASIALALVEPTGDGKLVRLVPEDGQTIIAIGSARVRLGSRSIGLLRTPLPGALGPLAAGSPLLLDLDGFLHRIGEFGDFLAWPASGWLADLHFVPAAITSHLHFSGSTRRLIARPLVEYPNHPPITPGANAADLGLPRLEGTVCHVRNLHAEQAIVQQLQNAGFIPVTNHPDQWQLDAEPLIHQFIHQSLPLLENHHQIHLEESAQKILLQFQSIQPKLEIVSSSEDWLSLDITFHTSVSNEAVSTEEARRILQGIANKDRRKPKPSREFTDVLQPLLSDLDVDQKNGRYYFKSASAESIRFFCEKNYYTHVINELKKQYKANPRVLTTLRSYQQVGSVWIADRLRKYGGALLADDMGLGKTIQTIDAMERLIETTDPSTDTSNGSVLVVTPTSLLGTWESELGRFTPERKVRRLYGAKRDAVKAECGRGEIWLTSYGTLTRDLAWFLRQEFLLVVIDEASHIRNPKTDQAKALHKLSARHRLALSGTPVENRAGDLWSIFRFIQPGWLGSHREFKDRYESPVTAGDPWSLRRLRIKITPFVMRRTKQEVAAELPSKTIINEFCTLTKEQQQTYRTLLVEGRRQAEVLASQSNEPAARMRVLTTLLRLRQTCCDLALLNHERLNALPLTKRSAKMERLIEIIDSSIRSNRKVLVFSQFRSQLCLIREYLDERGVGTLQLDGGTKERHALVDAFQAVDGPPVFLISLKAGGYGLNLTAADVVVHFDPWWNPAAEAQATDRAHRIGQTQPVTVYRLLTRGTVEEKVVALQQRKRVIAVSLDPTEDLDADESSPSNWKDSDYIELLR